MEFTDTNPERAALILNTICKVATDEINGIIGGKNFSDIGRAQLALGGLTKGVSTFEMAAAYSTFPRQGEYREPRLYTLVLDRNGDTLLDNTQDTETV